MGVIIMAISPLGDSFSKFGDIKKNNFATVGTLAAAVLSGLKGDPVGEILRTTVRSIEKDPKGAAELARQLTQLGAAVIRAGATVDETNAAHIQPSIEETTTTRRVEVGEGGKKTVKTTTTKTRESTFDPKAQAAQVRLAADQIEKFGAGLAEEKIHLGDEVITFGQLKKLFETILQFEKNSRKEEPGNTKQESSSVDINENGVVTPSPFQPSIDEFANQASKIYPTGVFSESQPVSEKTAPQTGPGSSEAKPSDDLDAVAGLAKTILGGEQLTQLKQLASALDDEKLAALIRKIVSS